MRWDRTGNSFNLPIREGEKGAGKEMWGETELGAREGEVIVFLIGPVHSGRLGGRKRKMRRCQRRTAEVENQYGV